MYPRYQINKSKIIPTITDEIRTESNTQVLYKSIRQVFGLQITTGKYLSQDIIVGVFHL
jgi:hypothetical protein